MEALETALRLMVLGQIILISLVLSVRGPKRVALPLVLLNVSVAGFLVKSSDTLSAALPSLQAVVLILAMAAPYLVWVCAKVLFGFERPALWLMIFLPGFTAVMCTLHLTLGDAPPLIEKASILASLIAVLHAIYAIGVGSLDDLSEPRRRFRLIFIASTTLCAVLILLLDLVIIGQQPRWVSLTNVIAIGAVFLVISVPLLSRPADLLPNEPDPGLDLGPDLKPDPGGLDVADQETHRQLIQAMDNRAYARTGLTIRQLAQELHTPEHQLRKLINQHLGFRNFSTFLNGYRIAETCRRLQEPAEARLPILTIALDAGFASLAPFNRAFRNVTGMTPSEYRRTHLKPAAVVTQLRR